MTPLKSDASDKETKLKEIASQIEACHKCALHCTRTKVVPGQGNPATRLVFVGEGPGEEEDKTGLAFVGRSGQLLTKMIEAMDFKREEVFIVNIVKCRPPSNRPPTPDEMAACIPYLTEQLNTIKPEIICALGKTAAIGLGLLKPSDSLKSIRGKLQFWNSIPVIVTYHPSYLLRSPGEKPEAGRDLMKVLKFLKVNPSCAGSPGKEVDK